MKFSELKEMLNTGDYIYDKLNIKMHIGIIEKKIIINKVIEDSIRYDNNIVYFDYLNKKVAIDWAILLNYTEIDIDDMTNEDAINNYDFLDNNGVFDGLRIAIGKDVSILEAAIEDEIDNMKVRNNTIEAVLAKGLNKLVEMIDKNTNPKAIKSVLKEAQKLDFDKLPMIKEVVNKLNGK